MSGHGLHLDRHDQAGVIAFRAFVDIELNLLACLKRAVAFHLNGGVVRKNIFATANRTDKAKAFGIVESFNCARLHAFTSLARHFISR